MIKQLPLMMTALLLLGPRSQENPTEARNKILHLQIDGIINPVSAEYITRGIDQAEAEGFHAVILEMDTPGGLLESTRQITKKFLGASVPVIVYVSPTGSRAASAGVFISYAANLVAMAPSTNIGAAHPVNMGMGAGADSAQNALLEKITNDAVAQIKGMAEKRGRNGEWAEKAVRESVSITDKEALDLKVINFISPSIDSLLVQLDAVEVETAAGKITLTTRRSIVVDHPMSWRYRVLDRISNPNIAYIFLMLGIYGLFFELSNPGSIFPGVVGALFLILAFFSMQTLPVNYAGLLLMFLAILLFILEVKITSYGLLTIGGLISLILGSLMLFEYPDKTIDPMFQISLKIVITFAVATAAFFLFAVTLALRTHRQKVTTGQEGLLGEIGLARTAIADDGSVLIHGEIWSAYSDQKIPKGQRVRVEKVEGLRIKVSNI